jgi:uncharacterized OB-fold protein
MSNIPPYPAPGATNDTAAFWEAAKQERLIIQNCQDCGNKQHYPRAFCISCLSDNFEWLPASGRGIIHTFTICHVPGHPAMAERVPYPMALIDLEEGVRMLAEIVGKHRMTLAVGECVEVVFEHRSDGVSLPQFRLSKSDNNDH